MEAFELPLEKMDRTFPRSGDLLTRGNLCLLAWFRPGRCMRALFIELSLSFDCVV